MTRTIPFGTLPVKISDTRQEMGLRAADEIAAAIRNVLSQKETCNVIFAAAPSQNEVLAALIARTDIEWGRVNAFHMDEYIGLAPDAPQGFANFLRAAIFDRVPLRTVNCLDGAAASRDAAAECAAAAGALAVRDRAGSGWGVYITAPALLPVPLSGDPLEDGGTDIAAIFVAVTDGRKAAVQQLEAPGDLSDPEARAAAAESAALQAVSLLLGLLEGEPSAEALRFSVSGLRRYVRPFWESLLRAAFPWKGDGMGLIVFKSALLAAVLLLAVAAGLYVSDAAGTRTADLYQQNRTILMAPGYTGPESDR